MSGRGCRGCPSGAILEASEHAAIPEEIEHTVGSTSTSMNQPLMEGQAGPSGPPEGAQVPGLFTTK